MTFSEKNNFVVKHSSDKYFEKDRELYVKTFPGSAIIKELQRAQHYQKKQLDERMLLELLNHFCGDTILENRGIFLSAKEGQAIDTNALAAAQELIVVNSVESLSFDQLKAVVKDLGLKPANNKRASIIAAIETYKNEMGLKPSDAGKSDNEAYKLVEETTSQDDKKKEDPDLNTQE